MYALIVTYILFPVGNLCNKFGSTKISDTGNGADFNISSDPGFVPTRHENLSIPDWGSVNPYHLDEI